ncbi:putative camp-dependent protein kinase catalytic subunit [Atractiella rhizophila]|nr:putative camp-dependent protein kinase catalytic subunit [Atractiella rhizophila]
MKVLEKAAVVRLKQVEHINQERSILGRVNNPFMVNLFCTFQDERNVYMILDFIQGGELFYHLRRSGRFTPDVARFYASNILLGIEYLHERDIIYRDLKPENLLLDELGYVKITDFGFAKKVEDRTFTLCGTPEYLAPEIIQATGHGKAADWWAFGILLFEMLCGWPPFYDNSPFAVYDKVLNTTPSYPPWIDAKAKDLISRLLTHDRSKRLGNLERGALDVKDHPWFKGVDFAAVESKRIGAPIIPPARSRTDTANFEKYQPTPLTELPGMARAYSAARNLPTLPVATDEYAHLFTMF